MRGPRLDGNDEHPPERAGDAVLWQEDCYFALHPRLRRRLVGAALHDGRYHHAVADAFDEVERVLRYLGQHSSSKDALELIQNAFEPTNGSLSDPTADLSSQRATQHLFMNVFRRYRSEMKTAKAPENMVQALEAVLLADLLLGELDRIAVRLGTALNALPPRPARGSAGEHRHGRQPRGHRAHERREVRNRQAQFPIRRARRPS